MPHLNHLKTVIGAATVALACAFAPSVSAQQQGGMPGMDMQMMMNHCAQVRQQVQQSPGVPHPAEVQQILEQCDQMDLMNSQMMMNHCAQVRQQVQQSQSPAMTHPAEVQQELARCDQMDLMNSQMNSQPGMNPAQQAPWPPR